MTKWDGGDKFDNSLSQTSYKTIAEHYSKKFDQHGATPQGLDWSNQEDMDKRYELFVDFINSKPDLTNGNKQSVLDFGCGYGGFYNYYLKNKNKFFYTGIDINENLILKARELHPNIKYELYNINIFTSEIYNNFPNLDYIICNGTFTVKHILTQKEMWKFMTESLKKLWTKTNKGIAFNCMSKILDFERDDLFHVSFDDISSWVYSELQCSKFTIRQDYGLREFTIYCYK